MDASRKERLIYQTFPKAILEIIHRYLRVKCFGTENLPKTGPAILLANHSGFMGFDAMMLSYQAFLESHRIPKIIAHKLWFFRPEIAVPAEKFGLVPATFNKGKEILEEGELLILFPEGEEGNFKPSSQRYHLKPFRRGFLRLAYTLGCPIIPVTIVGAEETHITLSQLRFAKELIGIILPVPLNLIPLPAKWSIHFHQPILSEKNLEKARDLDLLTKESHQHRLLLQKLLHQDLQERKFVFL